MERRTVAKGEHIVRVGETGRSMFFLVDGVVEVELPDGRSFLCNQGAFFGEIAMFLDQPRSASIRAHSAATILVLTREVCDDVMSAYPELQFKFQRLGEERLRADEAGSDSSNSKLRKWMRKIAVSATERAINYTFPTE